VLHNQGHTRVALALRGAVPGRSSPRCICCTSRVASGRRSRPRTFCSPVPVQQVAATVSAVGVQDRACGASRSTSGVLNRCRHASATVGAFTQWSAPAGTATAPAATSGYCKYTARVCGYQTRHTMLCECPQCGEVGANMQYVSHYNLRQCAGLTEASPTYARAAPVALWALDKLVAVVSALSAQCPPLASSTAHVACGQTSAAVSRCQPRLGLGQAGINMRGALLTSDDPCRCALPAATGVVHGLRVGSICTRSCHSRCCETDGSQQHERPPATVNFRVLHLVRARLLLRHFRRLVGACGKWSLQHHSHMQRYLFGLPVHRTDTLPPRCAPQYRCKTAARLTSRPESTQCSASRTWTQRCCDTARVVCCMMWILCD
jgi:hypothetical protein